MDDVVSFKREILLANIHHWKQFAETYFDYCYASKQFDDIIKCSRDEQSQVKN